MRAFLLEFALPRVLGAMAGIALIAVLQGWPLTWWLVGLAAAAAGGTALSAVLFALAAVLHRIAPRRRGRHAR